MAVAVMEHRKDETQKVVDPYFDDSDDDLSVEEPLLEKFAAVPPPDVTQDVESSRSSSEEESRPVPEFSSSGSEEETRPVPNWSSSDSDEDVCEDVIYEQKVVQEVVCDEKVTNKMSAFIKNDIDDLIGSIVPDIVETVLHSSPSNFVTSSNTGNEGANNSNSNSNSSGSGNANGSNSNSANSSNGVFNLNDVSQTCTSKQEFTEEERAAILETERQNLLAQEISDAKIDSVRSFDAGLPMAIGEDASSSMAACTASSSASASCGGKGRLTRGFSKIIAQVKRGDGDHDDDEDEIEPRDLSTDDIQPQDFSKHDDQLQDFSKQPRDHDSHPDKNEEQGGASSSDEINIQMSTDNYSSLRKSAPGALTRRSSNISNGHDEIDANFRKSHDNLRKSMDAVRNSTEFTPSHSTNSPPPMMVRRKAFRCSDSQRKSLGSPVFGRAVATSMSKDLGSDTFSTSMSKDLSTDTFSKSNYVQKFSYGCVNFLCICICVRFVKFSKRQVSTKSYQEFF